MRTKQPTRLRSGRGSLSSTPPVPTVTVVTAGYDQATVSYRVLLPGPLQSGQNYHLIRTSTTTAKLATTWANKNAGTAIDLTDSSAQITQGYQTVEFDTSIDGVTWIARAGTSYTYLGLNPSTTVYGRARTVDGTTFSAYGTANATTATATADVTAPTWGAEPPAVGTIGTVTSTTIDLSWRVPTDPVVPGAQTTGWASTKIRRNGVALPVVNAPATTVQDLGLNPATAYSYTWAALDVAGNESAQSAAKTATTASVTGGTRWPDMTPAVLSAVPGLAGFGTETGAGAGAWTGSANRAGATTTVYRIASLADPGPFRTACQASGPRCIVFDTSGTITLTSELQIYNDAITIAGETAPAPGIMLRGGTLSFKCNDFLVRHIHERPGDFDENGNPFVQNPDNRDCIGVGPESSGKGKRGVIDHCSCSWPVDENVQIWGSSTTIFPSDVTVANCLMAEGLFNTGLLNATGSPLQGYGPLYGGSPSGTMPATRVCTYRNVMALNYERNPFDLCEQSAIANNLIYGWVAFATDLGVTNGAAGRKTTKDVEGNAYIRGPTNPQKKPIYFRGSDSSDGYGLQTGGHHIYMNDFAYGATLATLAAFANPWDPNLITYGSTVVEANVRSNVRGAFASGLVLVPAMEVATHALVHAGAFPTNRDVVDTRIINNIRNNTGFIPDHVSQFGWPTMAVNTVNHTTNPILPGDPIPPSGTGAGTWNEIMPATGGYPAGYKRGELWCFRLAARLVPA